jgi:hypothetical protein
MKERKDPMVPRKKIIACVIRQYATGLYRSCVSLDENNSICLSTHQDEKSAIESINRFLENYQQGQIKTVEDALAFVDSMGSAPAPVEQNGCVLAA